jgi:hypothetical protein
MPTISSVPYTPHKQKHMAKKIEIKMHQPEVVSKNPKAEFAALIERYKIENPAKYELKKAALEAELKKL